MPMKTPIALTIAGSDSSGGAGVQADIKAISASGAFAASVITAVTAQNTTSVTRVHEVPSDVVFDQIEAVLSDLEVQAIKLGMLFSAPIIDAVAQGLVVFSAPIVVDPVMIAKSGDALLHRSAIDAMIRKILPLATLLTPNLPEAACLLGVSQAQSPTDIIAQGQQLLAMGPKVVLMKGGHADGDICTDYLIDVTGVVVTLTAPRVQTRNTHGTGCTYSAAIAAQLAKGHDLHSAVATAHNYLQTAIKTADQLSIGRGHGPVHHFHGQW
ncbi:MAG: bifunctional hydroxymethylpyrimidine kinase/phosphomethylpyrimidine kinase [Octadecabacter sp.]|nr:bifunctional hydroxymethylpyrimidine kinase/phosphomethylpyrimidine kinase [Octadecabacter sp.]